MVPAQLRPPHRRPERFSASNLCRSLARGSIEALPVEPVLPSVARPGTALSFLQIGEGELGWEKAACELA